MFHLSGLSYHLWQDFTRYGLLLLQVGFRYCCYARLESIPHASQTVRYSIMPKPRVIYWFRTDLRLHDSPALKAALDLKPECLYPIWTWDPHYVYRARVGPNRWQYLLDCQNDLSKSITKLNPKSKLFLIREAPQTLFPKLFKAWKITHLVFEKDTDAYARGRDAERSWILPKKRE